MQFLEKSWRPPPNSILDKQVINRAGKTVTTKFQTKWLDQRNWLAYSANPLHCGGWCKLCLLFLTTKEKDAALGAFVKSAFKNYSKSKEKLDSHESADYHKRAEERGLYAKTQLQNIANRIDVQLNKVTNQNIESNEAILPHIVDAARLCAVQQIPFRGHRDDKIQFTQEPTDNEGNFTAIIRLLAKSNPGLKDHLEHGPQNARYTSKTIQNEVIAVMANLIRDYFCQCLEKCPHFSLIADETTSHGREILSVCLRFLDFVEDPCCPIKREVLIDLCDLTRTTGKAIATALTESLKKHKIDIANCRGQAYDTTSSMSSSKKGVQAEIAKCAPDADYQGCCLHALNLAICHACEIRPIQNMMDSCRELYSFFDNSPKRQRFLDIVIDVLGKGETKKRKLKNLCKTRWIERHSTFETIYDLYEYVVTTLDEICVPSEDERFECPGEESWDWDASTRTLANGLRHTMKSFGHIFCFVCAMDMLEPMRPLVSALQGRLVEVYFGFKKVEEVMNSYTDIRSGIDKWFERLYTKVLRLSELVGSAEERPRVNRRGATPAETAKEYWKRAVAIPFLDIVSSELKSRFSHEKRAHYELCALVPEVISKKDENAVTSLLNVLKEKWEHILPLPAAFESELFRWSNHWKRQEAMPDESVTSIIASHADGIFFLPQYT